MKSINCLLLLSFLGVASDLVGQDGSNLPPFSVLAAKCSLDVRVISVSDSGLFLDCEKHPFRVTHPKNLYGLVKLRTREAAFQFVGFFTSRRTFSLLDMDGFVEVRSRGDSSHKDFYTVRSSALMSFSPTAEQYEDPIEGRVFLLTRYVVGLDQRIYRLKERVTEDGNYDLRDRYLVEEDASKFGIVHIGDQ